MFLLEFLVVGDLMSNMIIDLGCVFFFFASFDGPLAYFVLYFFFFLVSLFVAAPKLLIRQICDFLWHALSIKSY